jgi:16S rRNA (guanine966-N2)-methyltransferase
MTRIITGQARGRRLAVPKKGTRPTSDRVREAIFSSVESWLLRTGREWSGISVLDLYAGSGALGLESWSRGARSAMLIDSEPQAVRTIEANITELGADTVTCVRSDVYRWTQTATGRYDLCFIDPPYAVSADDLRSVIDLLRDRRLLQGSALVVVERPTSDGDSPFPNAVTEVSTRTYGDTSIWYGHIST